MLYAVLLANWIVENGYEDRCFVNADVLLWTRGGVAHERAVLVEYGQKPYEGSTATALQLWGQKIPIA